MNSRLTFRRKAKKSGVLTEIGSRVKSMDLFSAPIPQFNVKGKNSVRTHLGGVITIFAVSLTFLFALLKFQHLMENRNPSITTFQQEIEANHDNGFDLENEGFMIAFGIDTYSEGSKNDERFVKWVARNKIKTATGERFTHYIPIRNCTVADYAKFYEPIRSSASKVSDFKKNGGLYCLDLKDLDVSIYGSWLFDGQFSSLDLSAVPCGTQMEGDPTPIREDCEWDYDAAMDYLKTFNLVVLYNMGSFNQDQYGKNKIETNSMLHKVQIDPTRTNWVGSDVEKYSLFDEVSLF